MMKRRKSFSDSRLITNFNRLFTKQGALNKQLVSGLIREADGEVDVWVHPFFTTKFKLKDHFPKAFFRKQKMQLFIENENKRREEVRQGIFEYLKSSNRPLLIFVPKNQYDSVQKMMVDFEYKRPVILIKTENTTGNIPLSRKQKKEIQKLLKTNKIEAHDLERQERKKRNRQISKRLEELDIKQTNIIGETEEVIPGMGQCINRVIKNIQSNSHINIIKINKAIRKEIRI